MYDVISIGSATLDVFLKSPGILVESGKICVPYGGKVEVEEIHFDSGGGGTNSAVTFARQGLKAASVVKIGDDFAGEKVKKDLEGEEVDTSLVVREKGGYTDYSTILWAPDGGRTVLVYRGKTRLEVEDVDWEKLATKWFYVSSVEGNLEIIEKLQSCRVAKLQIKIAWNPGKKELEQREKVLALLPKIEVLNLNKEEMEELLRVTGYGLRVKELLKKAQGLPCRYIVITDERNGSYLWDGKDWFWSGIYSTPKVEATGAGDAYGSGFVTGLVKGWEIKDCLRLAAANASSVVLYPGAKRGILKSTEMDGWFRKELKIEGLHIE
jgi:ribokinase